MYYQPVPLAVHSQKEQEAVSESCLSNITYVLPAVYHHEYGPPQKVVLLFRRA